MNNKRSSIPYWAYWEGPRPPLIDLCLATLRRTFGVRVLGRHDFDALWTDDRDLDIDRLYVAHRADFIRAYLLRQYGGVWVDADCVALRPVTPLEAELDRYDMVVSREPRGLVATYFMMARPRSPTVRHFYDEVVQHLREKRPIDWLEIGAYPLARAIANHSGRTRVLDSRYIMPVCWSEAASFLAPLDMPPALEPDAYCYMLSNHSLPATAKTTPHAELIAAPNLLGALLRIALSEDHMSSNDAANYRYWQTEGWAWDAEYERRKRRHPYLHITELMLADHVLRHAPCRVLELGCGSGRQLRNVAALPGVDAHGFDQSRSMVEAGFAWAGRDWVSEHVRIGSATGSLPYPDDSFEIVYTSEALLHTRPEDLDARLAELVRVARGHILHIEPTPTWIGYSAHCHGCWGHDYVAAYRRLGLRCEILPSGTPRQAPYLVLKDPKSFRSTWPEPILEMYRRMEEALESGFHAAGVAAHA